MGDAESVSTRGNAISMSPKVLVLIIIAALGLAGGGSTVITGLFHGDRATSTAQESSAVQLAVLQTKVSNIEAQMVEFKEGQREQTELIRRLLMHESEDHSRKERLTP